MWWFTSEEQKWDYNTLLWFGMVVHVQVNMLKLHTSALHRVFMADMVNHTMKNERQRLPTLHIYVVGTCTMEIKERTRKVIDISVLYCVIDG